MGQALSYCYSLILFLAICAGMIMNTRNDIPKRMFQKLWHQPSVSMYTAASNPARGVQIKAFSFITSPVMDVPMPA